MVEPVTNPDEVSPKSKYHQGVIVVGVATADVSEVHSYKDGRNLISIFI